jgi:hypothetical protein
MRASKWLGTSDTRVFDSFWRFAAERQDIYFRRLRGEGRPWTSDPILKTYRFTNVYRAADRTTQYLIKNVIYGDPTQSPEDTIVKTIVFKLFNSIRTWERTAQRVDVAETPFPRAKLVGALRQLAKYEPLYSGAYVVPPVIGYPQKLKYEQHAALVEKMVSDGLPSRLLNATTLASVYELLRTYPSLGPFLAFQLAIDLNYAPAFMFDEMDFVVAGPGAKEGLLKCFGPLGRYSPDEVIRSVTEKQDEEFTRRGLTFQTLWGRPLQLIDVQNVFCEIAKYSRAAYPDVPSSLNRTRIKRRYAPISSPLPAPWFPPAWGINAKIPRTIPDWT